jgi:hypothetical protein
MLLPEGLKVIEQTFQLTHFFMFLHYYCLLRQTSLSELFFYFSHTQTIPQDFEAHMRAGFERPYKYVVVLLLNCYHRVCILSLNSIAHLSLSLSFTYHGMEFSFSVFS